NVRPCVVMVPSSRAVCIAESMSPGAPLTYSGELSTVRCQTFAAASHSHGRAMLHPGCQTSSDGAGNVGAMVVLDMVVLLPDGLSTADVIGDVRSVDPTGGVDSAEAIGDLRTVEGIGSS